MKKKRQTWQERLANLTGVKIKEGVPLTETQAQTLANRVLAEKPLRIRDLPKEERKEYQNKAKKKQRLKAYGITEEDFRIILKEQQGACAVCKTFLIDGACVDHDHATGIVRGILCKKCNLGLGHFSDKPEVLLEAANYIARFQTLVTRLLKESLNRR